MKLKKLIPQLAQGIIDAGFDLEPKKIQSMCLPKIKSGGDLFVFAPEGAGKSTTIVLGVIQQLKEAFEEAPRAIVMVETKEKAFAMEEQFKRLGKHTNLRTFTVFDQGIIQYQKDTIYEGLDILIGTPKRINELMSITGIPMSSIKILAVDDTQTFFINRQHPVIYRIADGNEKAQFLVFAESWSEQFELLEDRMLKNPTVIEVED